MNKLMKIRFGLFLLVSIATFVGLLSLSGMASVSAQTPDPTPVTSSDAIILEGIPASPGVFHPRMTRTEGSVSFEETASSDKFGYTREDSGYAWVDASGGTKVDFDGEVDDSFVGPVNLGFNFKFYEYSYSTVYISTNGILTFGSGDTYARNEPIPLDTSPNNLIAPLWDDLALEVQGSPTSGNVYYQLIGSSPNRYFVVQWQDVISRVGEGGVLTFQVLLFENGDIKFQYKTLEGSTDEATVGIEDADGLDGLLYAYNDGSNLTDQKAIRFIRPGPQPRIKFLSIYQSAFAIGGQASFEVEIRNTGELGSDTFDLFPASSDPNWLVRLYNQSGSSPLSDSDQDGSIDTASINQGASRTILLVVEPPDSANEGASSTVTLTARSSKNTAKQAETQFVSALPAPFAQAVADNPAGTHLNLTASHRVTANKVAEWFSGSTLAFDRTSNGGYIYTWERNYYQNSIPYTDIEFALLTKNGLIFRPGGKLTDNNSASQPTTDRFPVVAGAADGTMGVVWVRSELNQVFQTKLNVYFAILDSNGDFLFGPQNLTNNSNYGMPIFLSPRIAAVGGSKNSRFVITWVDQRLQTGEPESLTSDIYLTIFDTDTGGIPVKAPTAVTHSTVGGDKYYDPTVIGLNGSRIFLPFSASDSTGATNWINFMVLNDSGGILKSRTKIAGSSGWGPDAVQLKSGKLLLAWTNGSNNKISFTMLNDSTFAALIGITDLSNPNPRSSDFVSVTTDSKGRAILTWMDVQANHYLYYALLGDNGGLITPPLYFVTGQDPEDPQITTSYAGQGNAPYEGAWQTFAPIITR
jgi:hypothetical protein